MSETVSTASAGTSDCDHDPYLKLNIEQRLLSLANDKSDRQVNKVEQKARRVYALPPLALSVQS